MEDMQEIRDNFNHFDGNGDGHIDLDEFHRLVNALGIPTPEEETRLGFTEIDRDHNGTIEFDEFLAWWKER